MQSTPEQCGPPRLHVTRQAGFAQAERPASRERLAVVREWLLWSHGWSVLRQRPVSLCFRREDSKPSNLHREGHVVCHCTEKSEYRFPGVRGGVRHPEFAPALARMLRAARTRPAVGDGRSVRSVVSPSRQAAVEAPRRTPALCFARCPITPQRRSTNSRVRGGSADR